MKKFLTYFLIVTFFAATMVCGCPHESQASGHDTHHHADGGHHHGNGLFVKDCLGTDMQLPQQVAVSKPSLKHSFHFDDNLIDKKSILAATPVSKGIRAPPPGWPEPSQTRPSILLTTQRYLI